MSDPITAPTTLEAAIQSIDALEVADETRLKSFAQAKIQSVETFKRIPLLVGALSLSAAAAYFLLKQIQPKQMPFRALRRGRSSDVSSTR